MKYPNADNLLDVLHDGISFMNGRQMVILSIDVKENYGGKKRERIAGKMHDVIWKTQEVKSIIDALEKQATST